MVEPYDEETFLAYVEGDLPHDQRLAFENRMLQDARLRNLVAQLVLDRHRLRTLPRPTPPADLMETVHHRLERAMLLGADPQSLHAEQDKASAARRFRWRRAAAVWAVAAMFMLATGVFVVTLVQLAHDTPDPVRLPPVAALTQPTSPPEATPEAAPEASPEVPSAASTRTPPAAEPQDAPLAGDPQTPATPDRPGDAAPQQAHANAPAVVLPTPDSLAPLAPSQANDSPVDAVHRLVADDVAATYRRLVGWWAAHPVDMLTTPAPAQADASQPRPAQTLTLAIPQHLRADLQLTLLGLPQTDLLPLPPAQGGSTLPLRPGASSSSQPAPLGRQPWSWTGWDLDLPSPPAAQAATPQATIPLAAQAAPPTARWIVRIELYAR